MDPSQIDQYIRSQLARQVEKGSIAKTLLESGWQVADINAAFDRIEGNSLPPSSLPPRAATMPRVAQSIPQQVPQSIVFQAPAQPAQPAQAAPVFSQPSVAMPPTTTPHQAAVPTASPITQPPAVAPTQTPPSTPIPAAVTPPIHTRPKGLKTILLIICVIVVVGLLGGGFAYAYFEKIGPFAHAPYDEHHLISGLLAKANAIPASTYESSVALTVEPRDVNAKPFDFTPANRAKLLKQYGRDSQRARDVAGILYELDTLRPYPATLNLKLNRPYHAGATTTDPLTHAKYGYQVTEGGKNFALSVTFETTDAVRAVEQSYRYVATTTPIDGTTVIFTKDSPTSFYVPSEPPKPFLLQLQEMAKYLPPQINVSGSVKASSDWSKTENQQWSFLIDATGDFGDLTYKFNIEARKKDGLYYVRINNIPGIFGAIANLKDMWISVDPKDLEDSDSILLNSFSAKSLMKAEDSYKNNRQAFTTALTKAATIADELGLFTFSSPPRAEKKDGRTLYRYDLVVTKEGLTTYLGRLVDEAVKDPGHWKIFKIDKGLLNYLKSDEFNAVFAYYQANTTLTLWVDPKGFPAYVEFSFRFVPPDTSVALKDKQARLTTTLAFSHINQPVEIEKPEDATRVQDLDPSKYDPSYQSRQESKDASLLAQLSSIRVAAEIYYNKSNSYGTSGNSCTAKNNMFSDTFIVNMVASAKKLAKDENLVCNNTASAYAVQATLNNQEAGMYYCIDSSGAEIKTDVALGKNTTCELDTATIQKGIGNTLAHGLLSSLATVMAAF